MSLPLLRKFLRDSALILAVVFCAILLFEVLWIHTITEIPRDLTEQWMRQPFVKSLVSSLLGADIAETLSANGLVAFGFAAPFFLICTWTYLIAAPTRSIVGEIEKGTADLLLTLPLARRRVFASALAAWTCGALLLTLAPLLGVGIGVQFVTLFEPVEFDRVARICGNLFVLNFAIGCLAMFASSVCSRRGMAIGAVAAVLLGSFMFNYLAQRWPLMDKLSAFGPLHYYKPLLIVRTGQWPLGDMAVLSAAAVVFLTAAMFRYCRRDVPAA